METSAVTPTLSSVTQQPSATSSASSNHPTQPFLPLASSSSPMTPQEVFLAQQQHAQMQQQYARQQQQQQQALAAVYSNASGGSGYPQSGGSLPHHQPLPFHGAGMMMDTFGTGYPTATAHAQHRAAVATATAMMMNQAAVAAATMGLYPPASCSPSFASFQPPLRQQPMPMGPGIPPQYSLESPSSAATAMAPPKAKSASASVEDGSPRFALQPPAPLGANTAANPTSTPTEASPEASANTMLPAKSPVAVAGQCPTPPFAATPSASSVSPRLGAYGVPLQPMVGFPSGQAMSPSVSAATASPSLGPVLDLPLPLHPFFDPVAFQQQQLQLQQQQQQQQQQLVEFQQQFLYPPTKAAARAALSSGKGPLYMTHPRQVRHHHGPGPNQFVKVTAVQRPIPCITAGAESTPANLDSTKNNNNVGASSGPSSTVQQPKPQQAKEATPPAQPLFLEKSATQNKDDKSSEPGPTEEIAATKANTSCDDGHPENEKATTSAGETADPSSHTNYHFVRFDGQGIAFLRCYECGQLASVESPHDFLLPPSTTEDTSVGRGWKCSMNHWNPAMNQCCKAMEFSMILSRFALANQPMKLPPESLYEVYNLVTQLGGFETVRKFGLVDTLCGLKGKRMKYLLELYEQHMLKFEEETFKGKRYDTPEELAKLFRPAKDLEGLPRDRLAWYVRPVGSGKHHQRSSRSSAQKDEDDFEARVGVGLPPHRSARRRSRSVEKSDDQTPEGSTKPPLPSTEWNEAAASLEKEGAESTIVAATHHRRDRGPHPVNDHPRRSDRPRALKRGFDLLEGTPVKRSRIPSSSSSSEALRPLLNRPRPRLADLFSSSNGPNIVWKVCSECRQRTAMEATRGAEMGSSFSPENSGPSSASPPPLPPVDTPAAPTGSIDPTTNNDSTTHQSTDPTTSTDSTGVEEPALAAASIAPPLSADQTDSTSPPNVVLDPSSAPPEVTPPTDPTPTLTTDLASSSSCSSNSWTCSCNTWNPGLAQCCSEEQWCSAFGTFLNEHPGKSVHLPMGLLWKLYNIVTQLGGSVSLTREERLPLIRNEVLRSLEDHEKQDVLEKDLKELYTDDLLEFEKKHFNGKTYENGEEWTKLVGAPSIPDHSRIVNAVRPYRRSGRPLKSNKFNFEPKSKPDAATPDPLSETAADASELVNPTTVSAEAQSTEQPALEKASTTAKEEGGLHLDVPDPSRLNLRPTTRSFTRPVRPTVHRRTELVFFRPSNKPVPPPRPARNLVIPPSLSAASIRPSPTNNPLRPSASPSPTGRSAQGPWHIPSPTASGISPTVAAAAAASSSSSSSSSSSNSPSSSSSPAAALSSLVLLCDIATDQKVGAPARPRTTTPYALRESRRPGFEWPTTIGFGAKPVSPTNAEGAGERSDKTWRPPPPPPPAKRAIRFISSSTRMSPRFASGSSPSSISSSPTNRGGLSAISPNRPPISMKLPRTLPKPSSRRNVLGSSSVESSPSTNRRVIMAPIPNQKPATTHRQLPLSASTKARHTRRLKSSGKVQLAPRHAIRSTKRGPLATERKPTSTNRRERVVSHDPLINSNEMRPPPEFKPGFLAPAVQGRSRKRSLAMVEHLLDREQEDPLVNHTCSVIPVVPIMWGPLFTPFERYRPPPRPLMEQEIAPKRTLGRATSAAQITKRTRATGPFGAGEEDTSPKRLKSEENVEKSALASSSGEDLQHDGGSPTSQTDFSVLIDQTTKIDDSVLPTPETQSTSIENTAEQ